MNVATTALFGLLLSGIPIFTHYYKRKVPFSYEALGSDVGLACLSVFLIGGLLGGLAMALCGAVGCNDTQSSQVAILVFVFSVVALFIAVDRHSKRS